MPHQQQQPNQPDIWHGQTLAQPQPQSQYQHTQQSYSGQMQLPVGILAQMQGEVSSLSIRVGRLEGIMNNYMSTHPLPGTLGDGRLSVGSHEGGSKSQSLDLSGGPGAESPRDITVMRWICYLICVERQFGPLLSSSAGKEPRGYSARSGPDRTRSSKNLSASGKSHHYFTGIPLLQLSRLFRFDDGLERGEKRWVRGLWRPSVGRSANG